MLTDVSIPTAITQEDEDSHPASILFWLAAIAPSYAATSINALSLLISRWGNGHYYKRQWEMSTGQLLKAAEGCHSAVALFKDIWPR
jgi:hypothetical protein